MAQDLDAVSEIAIMQAVTALRQNAVTPKLVWRDIDSVAAQQNQQINVPIFNELSTQAVTAGSANTPSDVAPRSIPVVLDQWKEVRFVLSDREMAEIMAGSFPKIMERAVKSICNTVDQFVLSLLVLNAGAGAVDVGTSITAANIISLGQKLDEQAVPPEGRSFLVPPVTKAELLAIDTFHEADKVGDQGTALREGSLGRAFGFDIVMNQNFNTLVAASGLPAGGFTAGTLSAGQVNGPVSNAGGLRLLPIDTVTGTLKKGDIITIATVPGTYVVTEDYSGASGNLKIGPGLRLAPTATLADNSTVAKDTGWATGTFRGVGFHSDAVAFASRPLQTANVPGAIISRSTDPVTGISLRLTGQYINKQMVWSLDILYGGACIEEERIALAYYTP